MKQILLLLWRMNLSSASSIKGKEGIMSTRKEPPQKILNTPKKSRTGTGATPAKVAISPAPSNPSPMQATPAKSASSPTLPQLSPMQSACKEVRKARDQTRQDWLKSKERNKVLFQEMRNSKRAYSISMAHEQNLFATLQGLNSTIDMMEIAATSAATGKATLAYETA